MLEIGRRTSIIRGEQAVCSCCSIKTHKFNPLAPAEPSFLDSFLLSHIGNWQIGGRHFSGVVQRGVFLSVFLFKFLSLVSTAACLCGD